MMWLRLAALLAAVQATWTQSSASSSAEQCGDCGASPKVGVDFLGNDVGSMTQQPNKEACCEFCRFTNKATAWTYSTGADYPQGCWCKTQESHNPNCVPPACPRVSGNIPTACSSWGWTFVFCLGIGGIAYGILGTAYNKQLHGTDELPHVEFWVGLGSLVRDGVSYAFNTAAGSTEPSPARQDYSEIDRADPVDGEPTEVEKQAQKVVDKFRKKSKPAKSGPRTRLMEAAIVGNKKTLKELLRDKEVKAELDCGDQRGATAFHHACGMQPFCAVTIVCLSPLRARAVTSTQPHS